MGKSANFAHRPMTPLELFRAGSDTAQIARIFSISEAQALRLVSSERSAKLGLPDPHQRSAGRDT